MKTIYLDSDFKCHVTNDGTMREVKTSAFDGKCDIYIEGHRFIPGGESWTNEDGEVFQGEMKSPYKDFDELYQAQHDYELAQLADYESIIAELDALIIEMQYNTLTEGL